MMEAVISFEMLFSRYETTRQNILEDKSSSAMLLGHEMVHGRSMGA
jgi:hypothetical protein